MIPSHLISSLATAADAAISPVLRSGAPGQKIPRGEVGFVAAVVLGAVPDIARAWKPILNPHYSIRLTGVFCHKTPMASFTDSAGSPQTCELADLMVVVDDLTGATARRWAVLIQAKMANVGGGKSLSKSGDLVQLELMSRWPAFSLSAGFTPGARDFSTCGHLGVKGDSGKYGLIEPQPNPEWEQHVPAKSMPAGGDKLGTFLAKMVQIGQRGYGREATGTADDWSRTVDELLRVTSGLVFTHSASFPGSQPRHKTAVAFVLPAESGDYDLWMDGPPPAGGHEDREEGPGEGLSFLRIEIRRTDGESRVP